MRHSGKMVFRIQKQHLSIAVNISVVQFSKDNFVQTVLNALKTSGANPQLLKLEITETLLVNNIPDVKAKMKELQQHGVTFQSMILVQAIHPYPT